MNASTTPTPAAIADLDFAPACQADLDEPCTDPATHAMRCTSCSSDRFGCAIHMAQQAHALLQYDDRNRAIRCTDCEAEGPALTLFDIVPLPGHVNVRGLQ